LSDTKRRTRHGAVASLLAVMAFTTGAIAVSTAPASAATEVPAENLQATLTSPASGGSTDNFGVAFTVATSWDLPASAQPGDTTTFTVPRYLVANVPSFDLTDTDGKVLGEGSCAAQSCTVTYGQAIAGLRNVTLSADLVFGPDQSTWGDANDAQMPITVTDDGTTVTAGTYRIYYKPSTQWVSWSRLDVASSTPQYDFFYGWGQGTFTQADVGVRQTATFTIPAALRDDQYFDCSQLQGTGGATGLNYSYGPNPDQWTREFVNGSTPNPLQMTIASCSRDTIVITYVPDAAGQGFSANFEYGGSGVTKLTPAAIERQDTGPYEVDYTVSPGQQNGVSPLSTSRPYSFTDGGGAGQVPPTARPDTATTPYETALSVDVLANDSAAEGSTLVASTLALDDSTGKAVPSLTVTGGTYSVSDGAIRFTPAARFVGTADAATYQVADSQGNVATSTVRVTVDAPVPTAADDTFTTAYQTPATIDVLANDAAGAADAPLQPESLRLVDPSSGQSVDTATVAGGTYSVRDGRVVFTPSDGFSGDAGPIAYRIADAFGTVATARITGTVGAAPASTPTPTPSASATPPAAPAPGAPSGPGAAVNTGGTALGGSSTLTFGADALQRALFSVGALLLLAGIVVASLSPRRPKRGR